MDKRIKYLIIHCTATPEGREVTKEDIILWHKAAKPAGRGWRRLGYSDLISIADGLILLTNWNQDELIENHEMTWGASGINSVSRHIVYAGGMDKNNKHPKDTRTKYQKYVLEHYCRFMLLRYPWLKIAGHNEFSSKACPSFDVQKWLKEIGLNNG